MGRTHRRAALALAGAAALTLALPAADAAAINRVNCAGRTDFVTVWNEGEVCFANLGYTDTAIYNVRDVGAGNNDLTYGYSVEPWTRHLYAWHWQTGEYFDHGARGTVQWLETHQAT
ncbi:beta/gamma crystallin domain-containing protein [Kitasatospora sp. NPDC048540]|uniref:beta/gamma crystallin domain-containing protein n=1 Tax=unclassified Kitasatospora TaxID=2633591 RepID=UPI000539F0F0|nr:beta/gamma crystallin domain-containing protein [Kitasatospora sp. MBT63]